MKEFYVYVWKLPDGVPFYVGKGHGNRYRCLGGRHHNNRDARRVFQRIKREGLTPLLEILTAVDEVAAFALEIELIARYGRRDLNTGVLYNRTEGGEGPSGRILSVETRAKISAAGQARSTAVRARCSAAVAQANRQRVVSDETRAKISAANKGRRLSAEHREKIGAATRARWAR